MDPSQMTFMNWVLLGAGLGLVVGLAPLISGFVKSNVKTGALGFVASIAAGAILGLLLAIPVAAVFTWLIFRKPKQPSEPTSL